MIFCKVYKLGMKMNENWKGVTETNEDILLSVLWLELATIIYAHA